MAGMASDSTKGGIDTILSIDLTGSENCLSAMIVITS